MKSGHRICGTRGGPAGGAEGNVFWLPGPFCAFVNTSAKLGDYRSLNGMTGVRSRLKRAQIIQLCAEP
jgi:hypothetical protein